MARAGDEIGRLRERLDEADFSGLLISELGWDNPVAGQEVVRHDEDGTIARLVADKRGVGVWVVDGLPGPGPRRRIDVLIARRTRERLVIFDGGVTQLWMWPEQRASGAGFRLVSHEYHVGSRNEALLQRLATARFRLEEEDDLTVVDVLARVRRSFNAERVTKKFYGEFKDHRDSLVDQIDGLEFKEEVAWYASVLLNRLMLLYFLQKKGFLDGDRDYLRNRLGMVRGHLGDDAFYGFFRRFLLPLFHDGLGSHRQEYDNADIERIVGDVPYVNGGIFQKHVLEEDNEIDVPDEAFEEIFGFFDRYRWHLDDRPSDDVDEINPDVLGYVFEQLVNSKEMGAYYTKEDVTGYMTSVTLLPAFLDRVAPVAGEPWGHLPKDPDRYIHGSVRHGVDDLLPDEITVSEAEPFDRPGWEEKASAAYGHPGETWWEVVDRRRHCGRLRGRLSGGEITEVAEAITENLDLPTLVDDHLRSIPDVDTVESVYDELCGLTVLDPTCGSGAFLFAALEQLADLYLALIDRAEELVEAGGREPDFVVEARRHPNLRYFVLRSAQLNNLYGVDLMAEAGEIARLRLFLKLAAQVDRREDLEPFPDLDLNVKTGNLLVGVASLGDAERRLATDLLSMGELVTVNDEVQKMSEIFRAFVDEQATNGDPNQIADLKQELEDQLGALRERLNAFLYNHTRSAKPFDEWKASNVPFHWFIEFPQVFERGGFDIVLGNPPYLSIRGNTEQVKSYETSRASDLYAVCMERSCDLVAAHGRMSLVVKHAITFNRADVTLRRLLSVRFPARWVTTFGLWPRGLFESAAQRVAIYVGAPVGRTWSGGMCKWVPDYRPALFECLRYTEVPVMGWRDQWPVTSSGEVLDIFRLLSAAYGSIQLAPGGASLWVRNTGNYFIPVSSCKPKGFTRDGVEVPVPALKELGIGERSNQLSTLASMAGKIAYLWWSVYGDDFNMTKGVLAGMPVAVSRMSRDLVHILEHIGLELEARTESGICVMYSPYAGRWFGSYDWRICSDLTDQSDLALLEHIGSSQLWPNLCSAYARLMKSTGERPGVVRGQLPDFG